MQNEQMSRQWYVLFLYPWAITWVLGPSRFSSLQTEWAVNELSFHLPKLVEWSCNSLLPSNINECLNRNVVIRKQGFLYWSGPVDSDMLCKLEPPANGEVKAMPQVWQGCKGEKVSFSPASPLTLVAAATHLPSLWPIGCPKLNSA